MKVLGVFATCLLLQCVNSLQFILSTMDPMCMTVVPEKVGARITVSYIITGVEEQNVNFRAMQGGLEKASYNQRKEATAEFSVASKSEVELCWTKLDRKSKKVNFMISQNVG